MMMVSETYAGRLIECPINNLENCQVEIMINNGFPVIAIGKVKMKLKAYITGRILSNDKLVYTLSDGKTIAVKI